MTFTGDDEHGLAQLMRPSVKLGRGLPEVCRLGLATRGGSRLRAEDVQWALDRGVNYWNWCGHPDGLSRAITSLGPERSRVIVAVQFQARTARDAAREFDQILAELRTSSLDIATLYYVESEEEWRTITSAGGALEYLCRQKQPGRLRLIGLTSHQRSLAANWAETGLLDMLMIRYNAAHRGAEQDVFPVVSRRKIPVVTFTGLRWGALLRPTPADPPGFQPPAPADCYRFCLANEAVSVALAAPSGRHELEQDLTLLNDWRAPSVTEMEAIRMHGERVRAYAGAFW